MLATYGNLGVGGIIALWIYVDSQKRRDRDAVIFQTYRDEQEERYQALAMDFRKIVTEGTAAYTRLEVSMNNLTSSIHDLSSRRQPLK